MTQRRQLIADDRPRARARGLTLKLTLICSTRLQLTIFLERIVSRRVLNSFSYHFPIFGSSYKDEDFVFIKRATQIRGPPRRGTPLHLTTPAFVHETPPPPPSNYVTKGCELLLRVSPREHEMKRVNERVRVVVLYACAIYVEKGSVESTHMLRKGQLNRQRVS